GTANIPFMLTLPRHADLAHTPVLIFQHGLTASRAQVGGVANDYARAGYATIGIDELWHGARFPGHEDEKHNYTGAPGGDGLADDSALGPLGLFFDFAGGPGLHALDARVVDDNFCQAALDVSSLTRLLRQGDMSAIATSHPSLASLTLDVTP